MESFEEFKAATIKKGLANLRPVGLGSIYRSGGFVEDVFDAVYPEIVARVEQEQANRKRRSSKATE